MKMLIQPNNWSCLATSFAMVLDTPLQILYQELGHDGSEIIFPTLSDPERRRAFHVQEFIYPCHTRGHALVSIEACPVLAAKEYVHPIPMGEERLMYYMKRFKGVVVGEIRNRRHACAWTGQECYNPNGTIHGLESFQIQEFLALISGKANL